MVETAIYVALGALWSALLALLALPAVSRRATRLAQRRADLTAPLSAAEARAERDALRGRHAVDMARADRRAAQAQQQWAAAQIALGRQGSELLKRADRMAEQDEEIARQRQELAALGAELRARDAEIGAREMALRDAQGQRDAAQQRLGEIIARVEGAEALAVEERTHRMKMEMQIAALTRELDEGRLLSSAAREAEASEAPSTLPKARQLDLFPHAGVDEIHDRLADAAMRENDLGLRIKALAAARQEAEAAVRGARSERDAALRELARLRDADADLREAIVRLGHEIVAQHRRAEAPAEAAPTFVSQA